jgi:hypothetical protein
MAEQFPQTGNQHPEQWRADLNPEPFAGQNTGVASEATQHSRSAYDVKDVHRALRGFSDEVLKQIPVLDPGTRLEQGATYLDLTDPEQREFTARGDMEVQPRAWIVPKSQVDYQLWNRLIGVDNPERLGTQSERP